MTTAAKALGRKGKPQCLTPREVLILCGYSPESAINEVDALAQEDLLVVTKSAYAPSVRGAEEYVALCASRVSTKNPTVREYMETREVSIEALVRCGVGVATAEEQGQEMLIFPYWLGSTVVALRGRTASGTKGSARGSVFVPFNLRDISLGGHTAYLTEGETDCLVVKTILPDAPVFGLPGMLKREWVRHLSGFSRLIMIPDDDHAGGELAERAEAIFGGRLTVVSLPWAPGQWGKDASDFIRQNGPDALLACLPPPARPVPRLVSAKDLIRRLNEKPEWVIRNLIERGSKTLLAGPPKVGKTWIVLQMMDCATGGRPFLGNPLWTPGEGCAKAVLVEEEGTTFRLAERVNLLMGAREGAIFLHRQRIRLDSKQSLTQLAQDLMAIGPDLLILDPYAELHGGDENAVQDTQKVVAAIHYLGDLIPAMATVVVHHANKGSGTTRGSSALPAAVDTILTVSQRENEPWQVTHLDVRGRNTANADYELRWNPDTGRHEAAEALHVSPPTGD